MPISPNQGSTGGGTTVAITGTGLAGTTAVHFGTKPATIVSNPDDTHVNVVSPAATGTVGVTVTTPGGTSNPVSFYYVGAPSKAGLSVSSGPTAGGNTVTISGTGLATTTSVSFGANTAVPTVVSDSQLNVTVPAATAAGSVGVTVTAAGGSGNGLTYTYVATPTIGTLSPNSGPTSGGTAVTIPGTGLTTTQSVIIGGAAAPFSVISDTEIAAVTPPGTAGDQTVSVVTTGGTASAAAGFAYVAGPGI
ncbi:IPT/TIG domain-containing protein [Streptantibioticus ferralitis]|uniref:IPT/TIG domain-containing protein n=1 Tax=Streptantibioticus ferralitis TaxID=236510 RepID=A0ABT5YW31_9ACTN|nr:IPT/TIG domain-containing protein [Streptantibioticus ferralitis]MDF2255654.1 IPT/TIG domain-containing protein [Streptantibioticus ferralitis]